MKKKYSAVLLAAVMLFAATGCNSAEPAAEAELPAGTAVEVKTIERRDVATENRVSGVVASDEETSVYVATNAKCTAVRVKAGDMVTKGDVLCTIDLGSTMASYNAAKISYDSSAASYSQQKNVFDQQIRQYDMQIGLAEDRLALCEKSLEDTKALFAIGAASQHEIDTAELELQSTRTELSGLRLQRLNTAAQRDSSLSQLRASMENYRSSMEQLNQALDNVDSEGNVIAPASGALSSLSAVEGGFVSAGLPVAVISNAELLKISVSVSEALVPKLAVGDSVRVSVASVPVEFTGTIRTIEQTANEQTKLYGVTVNVPDSVRGLLSGMFAEVTFFTEASAGTIAIPSEAILSKDDEQFVYIIENGAAVRVPVKPGLIGDGVTEILEGLSAGQVLVVIGQQYLADGDVVRIVGGA